MLNLEPSLVVYLSGALLYLCAKPLLFRYGILASAAGLLALVAAKLTDSPNLYFYITLGQVVLLETLFQLSVRRQQRLKWIVALVLVVWGLTWFRTPELLLRNAKWLLFALTPYYLYMQFTANAKKPDGAPTVQAP